MNYRLEILKAKQAMAIAKANYHGQRLSSGAYKIRESYNKAYNENELMMEENNAMTSYINMAQLFTDQITELMIYESN